MAAPGAGSDATTAAAGAAGAAGADAPAESSAAESTAAAAAAQPLCSRKGCGQAAGLMCPTCQQLGLPPARFCGQACFRADWAQHKGVHAAARLAAASATAAARGQPWEADPRFVGYSFTGKLRPVPPAGGPQSVARRDVPDAIVRPDYSEDGVPRSEQAWREALQPGRIQVLPAEDQEALRAVCAAARACLDAGAAACKVGNTTDEIDRVVHNTSLEHDCYPSPLNYRNFPKSVCTSVNEVICHGIPDGYELQDGDICNIDVTCYSRDGFHGDLNETYFVGAKPPVDDERHRLVQATYDALFAAIDQVKPGMFYRDIGNIIEKNIRPTGFNVVKTYTGHGIHRLFHTTPNIPHYARNRAAGVAKAGHAFTIEPMVNAGTFRDTTWPDDWTSVTKDGRISAQFEHTLLVTETGCEILTARTDSSPTENTVVRSKK